MADKNHAACGRTFRYHGFQTRSDLTSRFVESPGRSDFTVTRAMFSVNVEVKQGADGFDMSNLRDNQREWATKYSLAKPFSTPYWIYLTIGTDASSTTLGKTRKKAAKNKPNIYLPKKTWFIPYDLFISTEDKIKQWQSTLPYQVRSGMKTEIQNAKLDAISLLSGYELVWNKANSLPKPSWFEPQIGEVFKTGLWTIPSSHPFWKKAKEDMVARAIEIMKSHKFELKSA